MIRIAIVEDDPACRSQLQGYLHYYETEHGVAFQISVFENGHDIAYRYSADYDIILMDIELGAVSGMDAAEIIRSMDKDVIIIFITNSPHYAIRGYSVEALDYVLKPVSYFAFSERLSRAVQRLDRRKREYIRIQISRGRVKKIGLSDVFYIEVQEHTLIYHTTDGDLSASGSMRELETQLRGKGFFRCNKGYLVNLQHVDGIRGENALVHGDSVQISRAKKKPFLDAVNDFLSEVSK